MHNLESAQPSLISLHDHQTQPFTSHKEMMAEAMRVIALLLQRHMVRHSQRLLDGAGTLDDTAVSIQEVLESLRRASGHASSATPDALPEIQHVERELTQAQHRLMDRVAQTEVQQEACTLPLLLLRDRFSLSWPQLWRLLLAAAPSLSPSLARLVRFATADASCTGLTTGLLAEVMDEDADAPCCDLTGMEAHDKLCAQALWRRQPSTSGHVLEERIHVSPSLLMMLRGQTPALPEHWRACCTLHRHTEAQELHNLTLAPGTTQQLSKALGAQTRRRGLLCLLGAPKTGRRSALGALLAHAKQDVLVCDLARMPPQEPHQSPWSALLSEARLHGAVLLVRLEEVTEAALEACRQDLPRAMAAHGCMVAVTAKTSPWSGAAWPGSLAHLNFGTPNQEQLADLWCQTIKALGGELSQEEAFTLCRRVSLSPGCMVEAAQRVRHQHGRHVCWLDALTLEGQACLNHQLDALAHRVEVKATWDQVVLPKELHEQLEEIIAHAAHRDQVLQDWGFGASMPGYGQGLSCLFSGPPGTGKTMVAGLIAKTLGRPLYQVDLSRVVSKFIGETEKNLAKLFEEATRAQAVLLFDEADSIFGKRTEVKSSHDRYANQEVGYLLQQMERYEGVTLLTTNLDKGLDEAFLRRIRFRLRFELPDATTRAKLWRAMLPKQAPVAEDICFETLGEFMEASGGHIRNAVLRAAFRAATRKILISMELLMEAAATEARETGHLIRW